MSTPTRPRPDPMPLTLTPARHPVLPAGQAPRVVTLLVTLTLGVALAAVLGWQLGVAAGHTPATRPAAATVTMTGHPGHPALATVTGGHPATVAAPTAATGAAPGHAALVTLTPATGVTGLTHLDRPLTAARVQRLAARTAPGIVTLTTDLGGGHGEAGTGITLTPDGDILTNTHVIAGYRHTPNGDTITAVDLGDDHTYPVTVLGTDPDRDIALVHLDGAHDLPVAHLGDSRDLSPGMQLASLGNAYGRELAIGAGPLVATGQTIPSTTGGNQPLTGLLRVHTGIVPGQSGGPLIDRDGRVVGITVAYLAGPDRTPSGDGYAIPLRAALHTAHHLTHTHLVQAHPEYPRHHHRSHTPHRHTTHHTAHHRAHHSASRPERTRDT